MIFVPAEWLVELMELTPTSTDYQVFLMGLGVLYMFSAWLFVEYGSAKLAKTVGILRARLTGKTKQRKEYKVIEEDLQGSGDC